MVDLLTVYKTNGSKPNPDTRSQSDSINHWLRNIRPFVSCVVVVEPVFSEKWYVRELLPYQGTVYFSVH